MALQLARATIGPSNEVYLHSYPATGMPNAQSAFTIMAWFNSNVWATSGTTAASIIGLYNGTNDAATVPTVGLQMGSAANNVVSCWLFGGTTLVASTGFTPPANTWFHFAYSCTAISGGNQTHGIYINGVLNNSSTNALQTAGVFTMLYVNGYPATTAAANTYTETSATQVDDIALYTRTLSALEISTIYNSGGSRDGIVNGLISKYKLNELPIGSSTVGARDFSGLGNNLAVVNRGSGVVPTYLQSISNEDVRPILG